MEGYDSLCAVMGAYPTLGIFRKFSVLNHRNLLLLQAQLVEKEGQLLAAIADDREDAGRRHYSSNFEAMMNAPIPAENEKGQRELMLEIRSLLSSYSMCPDCPVPSRSRVANCHLSPRPSPP